MSSINDLLNSRDAIEVIRLVRDDTPEETRDIPDSSWLLVAYALTQYYVSCMEKQIGLVEKLRRGEPQ